MRGRRAHYLANREAARALIKERIAHFASRYGVIPKKIFIKNLKSRWGSCSERGNLNFNYRLLFLPDALRDYVVVHELCHLREFNHSPKFWALVAQECPNWQKLRRELRRVR